MTIAAKAESWTGRVEDDALLRGQGRFGDDVKPDGALAACFVRSPHGFAKIERIDTADAKKMKGVVAVYTAADLAEAHYHSVSHGHDIPGRGGKMPFSPHRPALAGERVLHVGEPVAMVVAHSAAAAQDAADKIVVDYTPLDAVTDVREAVKPGAPQLWPEAPGNIGFDWTAPADAEGKKQAALDKAFKEAAHVVKVELVNQRLVVASLEPRTATASYDAEKNLFTLRCGSQSVAAVRGQVAGCLNVKPDELRIVTEDLGGAFGMKGWNYPEYVPMLHAARALKKTIHWVSTRSEAFVSDNQGRDSFWTVELALSARGKFLGLARRLHRQSRRLFHRRRAFRLHHARLRLPADGLRHPARAGEHALRLHQHAADRRPIAAPAVRRRATCIERVIDAAADATGIDAAELRRRNLIKPEQMPYTTAFGNTYDSGEFPAAFERALALADYAGFPARKKAAKKERKLRGIGIGCYLEIAGAFPEEAARISFPGGGKVECQHRRRRQRAGPSDRVRQSGGAPARPRRYGGHGDVRRFRARRARLRRGRLALGDVCRRRHRAHRRRRDREGQARRRHAAAGGRSRGRLQRRQVQREEPRGDAVRGGRARRRAQAPGRDPGKPRHHREVQRPALVPQRLPRRRSRDRRRHRRARDQELCRRRRLRQSARRHHRRRPDPRRRRAGARAGAQREHRLRRRAASSSPARSWTTPCRARTTCRR